VSAHTEAASQKTEKSCLMEKGIKNYIMGLMTSGGHKHAEMSQTLQCKYCGERMKKAEGEYNRLRRERPEKFAKKERDYLPDYPLDAGTARNLELLEDRMKRDKLYQRHIRLLLDGTPEERRQETARANAGFFRRPYT